MLRGGARGLALRRRAPASGGRRGCGGASGERRWGFQEEIRKCRHPEDLFAFFKSNRDLLGPADLCRLLEGLWHSVEKLHGRDGLVDAQRALFNTPEFMQVMKDVVWKIERFGPRDLPRLVAALHGMLWKDTQLLKIAEPTAARMLPEMPLGRVPRMVTSYVEARCGSRAFLDAVVHRVSQATAEFDSGELTELVVAFSQSPYKPRAFLMGMSPVLGQQLEYFAPAQLASLAEAYARWPMHAPPRLFAGVAGVLCEGDGRLLGDLAPAELVSLLRAFALCGSRAKAARAARASRAERAARAARARWSGEPGGQYGAGSWPAGAQRELFGLAVEPLMASRQVLQPKDLTTAMWAFSRNTAMPQTLFNALCEDLTRAAARLPEPGLAACLLAAGRAAAGQLRLQGAKGGAAAEAQRPAGAAAEERGRALLEAASDRVQRVAGNFPARELSSVVLAYSLASTGSAELFAVLNRACLERCRQLTVEQAARICWSFATVRLSDSLFRETQFDILEKMHQLPTSAICDLLWAYCVVRHRDPHFFKALLGLLTPSRVAGEPRCALLHPALLDIRSNLPDMDPEGLDRYLGYTHAEFHRSQLAAAPPEPALQSVAEALAAGGLRFETLADVDGYVADAVAQAPGEELTDGEDGTRHPPVAVLYHSSRRTLHSLTNEPLGQTMMRQRHLRWRGYGVVNLWSRAWDALDVEGRVNFLMARFKQAARQAAAPGGAGGHGRSRSE